MATTIAEPQDLPSGSITDDNAGNFAVLVYQKADDSAGLKQLKLSEWKSYLNFNSHKVDNIALYTGAKPGTGSSSDFPNWSDDTAYTELPDGVISLKDRITSIANQVGIDSGSVPIPSVTIKENVDKLVEYVETGWDDSGTQKDGLLDRTDSLESRMQTVENEISGTEPGESSIFTRLDNLEDKVGEDGTTPTGIYQRLKTDETDIQSLKDVINGPESDPDTGLVDIVSEHTSKISSLETMVGNEESPAEGSILYNVAKNTDDIATINTKIGDDTSEPKTGMYKTLSDIANYACGSDSVPESGYINLTDRITSAENNIETNKTNIKSLTNKLNLSEYTAKLETNWTSGEISGFPSGIYQVTCVSTYQGRVKFGTFYASFSSTASGLVINSNGISSTLPNAIYETDSGYLQGMLQIDDSLKLKFIGTPTLYETITFKFIASAPITE